MASASAPPQPTALSLQLALLIPDEADVKDPGITVWLDAASEEGIQITPLRDSEFLAARTNYLGLVLPDAVHKQASAGLIRALENYVSSGGNLMLVFDAGTLDERRLYAIPRSRLSSLAGVDYAFYATLRENTIQRSPVLGSVEVMQTLQVPPGRMVPFTGSTADVAPDLNPAFSPYYTIDTYTYGDIPYASFVNRGRYEGAVLLRSIPGIVAGFRQSEHGKVLFVNLSLGYLAQRTDGLLLHGFLHYFAERIGLPSLNAVPDATGGLVLNWHMDSNAAQAAMPMLESMGFFQQGPYSFHITAGPDRDRAGDGLGLDVPHNEKIQQWIHFLLQHGDTIGDHGGWIHNYFGARLTEDNQQEFQSYLERNNQALEAVVGKPIVEYSAPVGNHPKWVTQWLEAHQFLAYYFTGNAGMAPTRSYRDGQRSDHTIWSFPITNLGKAASLEDMHFAGVTDGQVSSWLVGISEFVASQRVNRLVYAHPPGAQFYPHALRAWLEKALDLSHQGTFRWYTMTQMAQFLNAREQVRWSATAHADGRYVIHAMHPQTLAHQSWSLPRAHLAKPVVTEGKASVTQDATRYIVIATGGTVLSFTTTTVATSATQHKSPGKSFRAARAQ